MRKRFYPADGSALTLGDLSPDTRGSCFPLRILRFGANQLPAFDTELLACLHDAKIQQGKSKRIDTAMSDDRGQKAPAENYGPQAIY